MLWWVLGGGLGIGSLIVAWLAIEKQATRRWRRRQRKHLQQFLLANPEAGELQVDGSFCYRRGPHVLRYLHHPDQSPPDHVIWLSVKQRVTEWDRPSHHIRQWVQVVASAWMTRLWCWQTGIALLLLLVLGIGLMDAERGQRARLEVAVAQALSLLPTHVRLERGGETMVEQLTHMVTPIPPLWMPTHWLAGRPTSYVLHVQGQDIGYLRHQDRFSARAEVWLQQTGSWRHGVLDGNRVTWDDIKVKSQK